MAIHPLRRNRRRVRANDAIPAVDAIPGFEFGERGGAFAAVGDALYLLPDAATQCPSDGLPRILT